MKNIFGALCAFLIFSCSNNTRETTIIAADSSTVTAVTDSFKLIEMAMASIIEVKVYNNSNGPSASRFTGWGYDIYIDGKKSIIQPSVPGVPGNDGFKTAELAKKVAEFVANKIRNNIMPPTVDKKELGGFGVDTANTK